MRDNHAYLNRLWVSAKKRERAINNEMAPDLCLKVPLGNILKGGRVSPERPRLVGAADEPDYLDLFGNLTDGPIGFPMLQYQELGFLLAYALGGVATSELSAGAVYRHTITPLASRLDDYRDLPTFTAVQRLGNPVAKLLHTSLGVDGVTLDVAKNDWLKAEATVKGTGKRELSVRQADISGTNGAASVTLPVDAVQGSSADERLASVHSVMWRQTGQSHWIDVKCTAASAATPAVLTIVPPSAGGSDAGAYRVLYAPAETTALKTGSATADPVYDYSNLQSTLTDAAAGLTAGAQVGRWLRMTSGNASGLIAKISANTTTVYTLAGYDLYAAGVRSGDTYEVLSLGWLKGLPDFVSEPAMRINDVQVILGGVYDGSSFLGGRVIGKNLNSLKWTLANALEAEFLPGDRDYTSTLLRGQRRQTLTFDRRMQDAIYQALLDVAIGSPAGVAPVFGVRVFAEGPVIAGGYTYQAELVWPRVSLKAATPELDGEKLKEAGELTVQADPTYGPIVAKITNTVATYAA